MSGSHVDLDGRRDDVHLSQNEPVYASDVHLIITIESSASTLQTPKFQEKVPEAREVMKVGQSPRQDGEKEP